MTDPTVQQQKIDLQRQIAEVRTQLASMTAERPRNERDALASAQARADSVESMFGRRASAPLPGERPLDYRKRLVRDLQRYSPAFRDVRLDSADAGLLDVLEEQVYADAAKAGRSGEAVAPLALVPVVETDSSGRKATRYFGDPIAWMAPYMGTGTIGRILRPEGAA